MVCTLSASAIALVLVAAAAERAGEIISVEF